MDESGKNRQKKKLLKNVLLLLPLLSCFGVDLEVNHPST